MSSIRTHNHRRKARAQLELRRQVSLRLGVTRIWLDDELALDTSTGFTSDRLQALFAKGLREVFTVNLRDHIEPA